MTNDITAKANTHQVDPARLESGTWSHRLNKTVGQGDISASYSADRIGMDKPARKPFSWQGALWVCVSLSRSNGAPSAKAYRLVHPQTFHGKPLTYAEKVADGNKARVDPNGFYHGMSVKHSGKVFVLCGPPVTFVPGQTAQLDLFATNPTPKEHNQ